MANLIKALNLEELPEYDYLMVFKRVTAAGDYEGIFVLKGDTDEMDPDSLSWCDIDESEVFESEVIEPIVFEDRELGYIRALHKEEGVYGPSSKAEFAPLVRQLASLLLSSESEDYRRAVERSLRIFEWIADIRSMAPKKIDWIGVYFHADFFGEARGDLLLGPFIGAATDHVRIGLNQGLCGLALSEERVVQADDVRQDPRHIACSLTTRSELIVPLADESGELIAELDVDSDSLAAFDAELRSRIESECANFHELL